MIDRTYPWSRFVVAGAVLTVGACNGTTVVSVMDDSQQDQIVGARVGQEVDITLGTVGPGQFDSIPVVSSSAVRFLDASIVGPFVPAGPRQLFRFTAQTSGVAIVTFRHTGTTPTVIDTITVR